MLCNMSQALEKEIGPKTGILHPSPLHHQVRNCTSCGSSTLYKVMTDCLVVSALINLFAALTAFINLFFYK